MASHGFVVISPFTYYSLPTSQYNAEWMNHVDNWSQKNLQNKLVEEEGKYLGHIALLELYLPFIVPTNIFCILMKYFFHR